MEYYSAMINNEITSFAATWIDLEIIILSEVSQRQISYDITYIWNLKKNNTNELIYKTEIDPQTWKTNLWLPGGKGGRGINWKIGNDIYTLLYINPQI